MTEPRFYLLPPADLGPDDIDPAKVAAALAAALGPEHAVELEAGLLTWVVDGIDARGMARLAVVDLAGVEVLSARAHWTSLLADD